MTTHDAVIRIARRCIFRANSLMLSPKKADLMALDYFVGAAVAAEEAGDEALAQALTQYVALLISTRGMAAVRDLIPGDGPVSIAINTSTEAAPCSVN
jgi:hypothetical protein